MVRGAGLEPARYFYHEPLKLACLPVPPPSHRVLRRYFWLPEGLLTGGAGSGALAGALIGAGAPGKRLDVRRRGELYSRYIELAKHPPASPPARSVTKF